MQATNLIKELRELRNNIYNIDKALNEYNQLVSDYDNEQLATYEAYNTIGFYQILSDEDEFKTFIEFILDKYGVPVLKYTVQNYEPAQAFHIIDGYGHLQPATNKDVVHLIDLAIEYLE